eukprot:scaffold22474_cov42-Phaeocystis_antarctica.AAC.1
MKEIWGASKLWPGPNRYTVPICLLSRPLSRAACHTPSPPRCRRTLATVAGWLAVLRRPN